MKKFIILISIILFITLAFFALRLGAFVYPYRMDKLIEIPQYDILDFQFDIEKNILADYKQADYTADDPYIIIDPYGFNPLSALILFEVNNSYDVEVTVAGEDEYSTYTYIHSIKAPRAEVPVIGMYAGRTNNIFLTVDNVQYEYNITTEPLPVTMQQYTLESSKPEKMAEGITLFIAFFEHSRAALVDSNGQVRGYVNSPAMAKWMPLKLLENGNMIAAGDEYKFLPYNMASLFEYNWLGKIFKEYEISHAVHHGVYELTNGDLLLTANHADMFVTGTREDVAIIIDRKTGEVIKEYDYREIVNENREPFHYFNPPVANAPNRDWMHMNAAIFDDVNNAVIVSSPTQSMVISINADTSQINWLLGPHDGYGEEFKQYLLTPIGENFEWSWCQHEPSIIGNNEEIIDILLFDNGQSKSFTKEGSIPASKNYSRAVHYRINQKEMTVEQIWQYGKERGAADYSTFLGGVEKLGDNILISFGGQLRMGETPVDEIFSGVFGDVVTRSRVLEVATRGGQTEVVYEVSVREAPGATSAETYQVKRIPIYVPESFDYRLGEVKAERLGTSYKIKQTNEIKAPNLYIGSISVEFKDIHRESNRLIIDGTLLYKNEPRLIGRAYLIFRGKNGSVYIYAANSAIHGRFLASIDLNELPSGEYQLSIAGGLAEGNDAINSKVFNGYFKTQYKIKVD